MTFQEYQSSYVFTNIGMYDDKKHLIFYDYDDVNTSQKRQVFEFTTQDDDAKGYFNVDWFDERLFPEGCTLPVDESGFNGIIGKYDWDTEE